MEIFKLIGSIMVDTAEANASISKTADKTEGLGKKLAAGAKTAASWAAGVATAALTVGTAMVVAAKGVAADLDAIDKGSQRMGITAEQYQELAYAAGMCGVEMSTMEKAAKKLEGTNLDMDEALTQLMSIGDETVRTQAAIDLFGESIAYEMGPLLQIGADEFTKLKDEAHELGIVMSDETVAAGAAMNDSFSKVEQALKAAGESITVSFFPYLQEILDWVIANLPLMQSTVQAVLDAIMPAVETVITTIMDLLPPILDTVMTVVDAVMPYVQPVLDTIASAIATLLQAIMTGLDLILPYVQPILDAIGTAVSAIISLISGDVAGFISQITTVFTSLVTVMTNLGSDIFGGLWDGLKSMWTSIDSWINGVVNSITDWFSGLGARISGFFGFGGDDGSHAAGLPTVPYDNYKANLHRGETVLNANDTGKLLDAINNGGGESGPVNITVQNVLDGKVIGEFTYQYNRRREMAVGI